MECVEAHLIQSRLVSEQVTSLPAQMMNDPKAIQVRTETSSGFSVGLDHPDKPKTMTIELVFKVTHVLNETSQKVADYEAKHMALFEIRAQSGIDSWLNVPTRALAPYFSFLHGIAMRRAEHTFLDMGLRGVVLPRIADYGRSEAEPVASIVEQARP
jgi:hypothetical protein